MAVVIFSLLFVNIFDTVGTLLGLADKTGIIRPDGSIPHVREAMLSDAIGTSAGALLGSSTITTYVESAAGVAEGGRSGCYRSFVLAGPVPLAPVLAHPCSSYQWRSCNGGRADARLGEED